MCKHLKTPPHPNTHTHKTLTTPSLLFPPIHTTDTTDAKTSSDTPLLLAPTLYITVFDTISARTLHRVTHFYAGGPVR